MIKKGSGRMAWGQIFILDFGSIRRIGRGAVLKKK
jgi:hypothetical protein